jgi:quinoprotein glucose dehydrogenase
MLANPVAFTFDERGRLFVAETYRYRSSVLDIRDFIAPMLEADLALRTVEDRVAMIEKILGREGVKELSIESERVRLVEDRDGDGKADFSSIYAEGFDDPLDGIAATTRSGSPIFRASGSSRAPRPTARRSAAAR